MSTFTPSNSHEARHILHSLPLPSLYLPIKWRSHDKTGLRLGTHRLSEIRLGESQLLGDQP